MPFRAPTGQSDFAELRRRGLTYVDKSHLITELIDDTSLVVLLPRPRRFGKTTNLSMLRYFFERSPRGEDRADLFEDLGVWRSEVARAHFQRYPVISLTLKEIKPATWAECQADLSGLISSLYREHLWLLDHPSVTALDRATFEAVARRQGEPTTLKRSLLFLSELLHLATGEQVVILIDEYDTPIHAGWLSGYYREVVDFFRVFLGAGLKDNGHLARGVLTGILRISKESIFSDMNHLAVYSLLREEYSTGFGFTEAEVTALAQEAGASQHLPVMRRWYNGYRFGGHTIYNPWSVLNFLASEDHEPRPYWVNTSSNDLIGRLITAGDPQLTADLEVLLAGGKVRKPIDEGLVLTDLDQRSDAVWSLLLWSGYLKPAAVHQAGRVVTLAVPNREVLLAYDTLLQRWMQRSTGGSAEVEILLRAMLKGDVELFEDGLQRLVMHALSFLDVGGRDPERVYHAFTLGLLVQLRATHKVESNRESGLGRADVLVIPRKAGRPGAVLEFKRVREHETPETALDAAMAQIQSRAYGARILDVGASAAHAYGVVFDGKRVRVRIAQPVAI